MSVIRSYYCCLRMDERYSFKTSGMFSATVQRQKSHVESPDVYMDHHEDQACTCACFFSFTLNIFFFVVFYCFLQNVYLINFLVTFE
jgi:hypothetical protein